MTKPSLIAKTPTQMAQLPEGERCQYATASPFCVGCEWSADDWTLVSERVGVTVEELRDACEANKE